MVANKQVKKNAISALQSKESCREASLVLHHVMIATVSQIKSGASCRPKKLFSKLKSTLQHRILPPEITTSNRHDF